MGQGVKSRGLYRAERRCDKWRSLVAYYMTSASPACTQIAATYVAPPENLPANNASHHLAIVYLSINSKAWRYSSHRYCFTSCSKVGEASFRSSIRPHQGRVNFAARIFGPTRPVPRPEAGRKKRPIRRLAFFIVSIGRDGVIRTHDPVHPMHVRYQAALRPDEVKIIADAFGFLPCFPRDSLLKSRTRIGCFIRPASVRASPCVCLRPGRGSARPGCAHGARPGPGTWQSWR